MAACARGAMGVNFTAFLYRDRQQPAITHPSLGNYLVRDGLNISIAAFKDRYFQATVVIEMHMHRRQRHVVMLVKRVYQPIAQLAGGMVVNINQRSNAVVAAAHALYGLGQSGPRQVSDSLGAVLVSTCLDDSIDVRHEVIVDGDRNALHEPLPFGC
jgi:hypothetical protein